MLQYITQNFTWQLNGMISHRQIKNNNEHFL